MNAQQEYDRVRTLDWLYHIPGYQDMTRCEKKRAKKYYRRTRRDQCSPKKESAMNSATCMTINAPAPLTEANTESQKRNYLDIRLQNIFYKKDDDLHVKFGLADDHAPRTPQEVIDRVKAGNFKFTDEDTATDEEAWLYSSPWRGIRWRDPAVKVDRDGYQKAFTELKAARDLIRDTIQIKDPVDALAEVLAWEAQEA